MNEGNTNYFVPDQPDNPTDAQRHTMARYALTKAGRPEDYENIARLMSAPPDITKYASPGRFKGIKVGIIGAGLAGLSAAFELRKLGFDITIFEANADRIGGKVYTYYFDRDNRHYGEFGAMRIPVTHETVWHYIKKFNMPVRPFIQTNENALIYLRNVRVRNDADGKNVMKCIYPKYCLNEWERKVPWQQLAYYGLESHLLCADPEQRTELLEIKPYYNPYTLYWDFQGIKKIMETTQLSQDAINMISSLSPLAGGNMYNSYIDLAQAFYPVNLAFLYEIAGGTSRLPHAFYSSLRNSAPAKDYPDIPVSCLGKVNFRLGNWVTGIYGGDKGSKVTIAFQNNSNRKDVCEAFDYIVCAIPFSTLRTVRIEPLFNPFKMQAIKEVNYIDSTKSLMLCSRRFWEEQGIVGGGSYTDLPIETVWYPSDHAQYCKKASKSTPNGYIYNSLEYSDRKYNNLALKPGVLLASYCYGLDAVRLGNLPPQMQFNEIKRQVEELHGLPRGYLNNVVISSKTVDWDSEKWARGALCFLSPEQKRIFSYAMSVPEYDNRVFMAGDHISAIHRWMQGALQSGMTAANQLACACGRRSESC